jgi:hypothetical protein
MREWRRGKRSVAVEHSVDAAKSTLAQLIAARDVAQHTEARRRQLSDERSALIDAGKRALAAQDDQDRREADRLAQIERRIATRAASLRVPGQSRCAAQQGPGHAVARPAPMPSADFRLRQE